MKGFRPWGCALSSSRSPLAASPRARTTAPSVPARSRCRPARRRPAHRHCSAHLPGESGRRRPDRQHHAEELPAGVRPRGVRVPALHAALLRERRDHDRRHDDGPGRRRRWDERRSVRLPCGIDRGGHPRSLGRCPERRRDALRAPDDPVTTRREHATDAYHCTRGEARVTLRPLSRARSSAG